MRRSDTLKRAFGAAGALVVAATAFSAGASAQAPDFYKGKTITIIVGYPPGGSFDHNARLLARYIGRYIPGKPDVIVSNMPGATSLTSVLYLDTTAPKDGTTVDVFNFGLIGGSRMGMTPVKVDFRKYHWLGSVSQDVTACYVWHTRGIRTIADAKTHGVLHFGLNSFGASNDINQKILMNVFGVHIQQVPGYSGTGPEELAVERGELEGTCETWGSLPADWRAKQDIVALDRSAPILPADMPANVPYLVDIAPTPRDRQIVSLLVAAGKLGEPFIVSSAVPADRVNMLRDAFAATMQDPEFQADAANEHLPLSPTNAADAVKTVDDIYATPDDIVAAARKILGN